MTLNEMINYLSEIRDEAQAGDMEVNLNIEMSRDEKFVACNIDKDTGKRKEFTYTNKLRTTYATCADNFNGFTYQRELIPDDKFILCLHLDNSRVLYCSN